MEKLKNKYEILLGFATLVISLSALKTELTGISIKLGYISFNLFEYILYSVYGFSFCFYLYILEHIFTGTKIYTWKIWDYLSAIGLFLYRFLIILPLLLLINIAIYQLGSIYTNLHKTESDIIFWAEITFLLFAIFFIIKTGNQTTKQNKTKLINQYREHATSFLNLAEKSYSDNKYLNSYRYAYKAILLYIYAALTEKGIRFSKGIDLTTFVQAHKASILTKEQTIQLNEIYKKQYFESEGTLNEKDAVKNFLDFTKNIIES